MEGDRGQKTTLLFEGRLISEEETEELLKFLQKSEDEAFEKGFQEGREVSRHIIYIPLWPTK